MIPAVLRRRKGQNISADFAIAMGLFVVTIAVSIFYVSSVLTPASPFSSQLESSAVQAVQTLQREGSWTVQQVPVSVVRPAGTGSVSDYPVVISSVIPDSAAADSWGVRHHDRLMPFHVNQTADQVAFVADITGDIERFMTTYHRDGAFLPPTQITAMDASTSTVDTGEIAFDWDTDGIESLTRDGTIYANAIDLGSGRTTHLSNVTARGSFPDGDLTAFTGSPFIHIDPSGTSTITMTLPGSLDQLNASDGSGTELGGGSATRSEVDWVELTSDSRGLVIAGDLDSVTASDSGNNVTVDVTTGKRLLLYPHSGSPATADDERSLFLDGRVHVLPERPVTGLSRDRLINIQESGDTRAVLGLADLGYNITISATPPIGMGSAVDTDDDVSVFQTPAIMLDRFGRTNLTTIEVTVWL